MKHLVLLILVVRLCYSYSVSMENSHIPAFYVNSEKDSIYFKTSYKVSKGQYEDSPDFIDIRLYSKDKSESTLIKIASGLYDKELSGVFAVADIPVLNDSMYISFDSRFFKEEMFLDVQIRTELSKKQTLTLRHYCDTTIAITLDDTFYSEYSEYIMPLKGGGGARVEFLVEIPDYCQFYIMDYSFPVPLIVGGVEFSIISQYSGNIWRTDSNSVWRSDTMTVEMQSMKTDTLEELKYYAALHEYWGSMELAYPLCQGVYSSTFPGNTWYTMEDVHKVVVYSQNLETGYGVKLMLDSLYITQDTIDYMGDIKIDETLDSIRLRIATDSAGNGIFMCNNTSISKTVNDISRLVSIDKTGATFVFDTSLFGGRFKVYSLSGKQLYQTGIDKTMLSIPQLAKQPYIYSISSEHGVVHGKHLIK